MKAIILTLSVLPMAIPASCWRACECAWLCPVAGAWACIVTALLFGAAIHAVLSIAWELHLLSH